MIKKTTQKIKSEVAKITVADKENGASHIIVVITSNFDLDKSTPTII